MGKKYPYPSKFQKVPKSKTRIFWALAIIYIDFMVVFTQHLHCPGGLPRQLMLAVGGEMMPVPLNHQGLV